MIAERILKYPGFIYEINGKHFYLGKWICKECVDAEAQDCTYMYHMNRSSNDPKETNLYFQKIRAYCDFALEVPYNPSKIRSDLFEILEALSEEQTLAFEKQLLAFEEDYPVFCGNELPAIS